ncbi:MAG: phosphatidylinositol kinase, partial [Marmoricola sp.]
DGRRYGVDHGICFHPDDKLRTVLWGWAGEPLTEEETAVLGRLAELLEFDGELETALAPLLTTQEISRTRRRCRRLRDHGMLPIPRAGWPAIPWPPF